MNEIAETREGEGGRDYWNQLFTCNRSKLLAMQKGSDRGFAIESLKVELDAGTAKKIVAGEKQGLWSAAGFLLSGWAVLLQKLRYQEEETLIAVGVDGRSQAGLERVVGPLMRYLPVVIR